MLKATTNTKAWKIIFGLGLIHSIDKLYSLAVNPTYQPQWFLFIFLRVIAVAGLIYLLRAKQFVSPIPQS